MGRTLYIGVTSDLHMRSQNLPRQGTFEGFSKTYGCTRLLCYEQFVCRHPHRHRTREATQRLAP